MAKLGFLGLGIMGYPMARNLRRAGHGLWAWSHTAAKAEKLAEAEGATVCTTPKAVAENAECVFLCVGNTGMSRSVILGENGVIAGARPGSVVVDASTISASASREIGERLAKNNVHFLDAPCTGSKLGAEEGKLTFMVGGDREVFERVRGFFGPMGRQLFYCGEQGMGLCVKLTQNLIQSNILEAFIEGIVLSTKAGVDPHCLQSAFHVPERLLHPLLREVDAQGYRARPGAGGGTTGSSTHHQRHATDGSGGSGSRLCRRGFLFCYQGVRGTLQSRGERKIAKNTFFGCISRIHILLLKVGRGGNSHQSETNLTKKTPEAKPPRHPIIKRNFSQPPLATACLGDGGVTPERWL